jgi:prepilin-type processing-associated H-X9-DG protein
VAASLLSSGFQVLVQNYGPSSGHSNVVNHLFVDGHTASLPRDMDTSAYMFDITRKGNDPYWEPSN